jgi:SAM-dependent methyltransferase
MSLLAHTKHLWWRTKTLIQLYRHRARNTRCLEIGPGSYALPGFETLSICGGRYVDYVADASQTLPFPSNTFDLIYASHVLEHIPWYRTCAALVEWRRILKPGGQLEVWVPDMFKIAKALVTCEESGTTMMGDAWYDPWRRLNPSENPYLWFSGRIYAGAWSGNDLEKPGPSELAHPNWHRALFTPRYLQQCLTMAGFCNIRRLKPQENRGQGHGWIDLGYAAEKPTP